MVLPAALISDKFPDKRCMLLMCLLILLVWLVRTDRRLVPPPFMQIVNERHVILPNALFRIDTMTFEQMIFERRPRLHNYSRTQRQGAI